MANYRWSLKFILFFQYTYIIRVHVYYKYNTIWKYIKNSDAFAAIECDGCHYIHIKKICHTNQILQNQNLYALRKTKSEEHDTRHIFSSSFCFHSKHSGVRRKWVYHNQMLLNYAKYHAAPVPPFFSIIFVGFDAMLIPDDGRGNLYYNK